jgi:hypothetical protein
MAQLGGHAPGGHTGVSAWVVWDEAVALRFGEGSRQDRVHLPNGRWGQAGASLVVGPPLRAKGSVETLKILPGDFG